MDPRGRAGNESDISSSVHGASLWLRFYQPEERDSCVADGSWLTGLDGDIFALTGSTRFFASEVLDDTLRRRLAEQDISPTGVLAGKPRPNRTPAGPAAALEAAVLSEYRAWLDWLAAGGVEQDRRNLRLVVGDVEIRHEAGDVLPLAFCLPKGGYARRCCAKSWPTWMAASNHRPVCRPRRT